MTITSNSFFVHQVNSSGSEICKERVIWPACLPRSEILSDMAYIRLSGMEYITLSDMEYIRLSANHLKVNVVQKEFSQITSQVRNTYSYGSLNVIFTNSSHICIFYLSKSADYSKSSATLLTGWGRITEGGPWSPKVFSILPIPYFQFL